jgi:hypothetical protein
VVEGRIGLAKLWDLEEHFLRCERLVRHRQYARSIAHSAVMTAKPAPENTHCLLSDSQSNAGVMLIVCHRYDFSVCGKMPPNRNYILRAAPEPLSMMAVTSSCDAPKKGQIKEISLNCSRFGILY